jgi:hypothetical protein
MAAGIDHFQEAPIKMAEKVSVANIPAAPVPTTVPSKVIKINALRSRAFGFAQIPSLTHNTLLLFCSKPSLESGFVIVRNTTEF